MKPREKTPKLNIETVNGKPLNLDAENPENFTMLVFYRGIHCPVCKSYLEELNGLVQKFEAKGVNVITISMDTKEIAQKTKNEWDIENVKIGYGLSEIEAREWGLYISESIKDSEPEIFSEPGLFLVKPDRTLYYAAVQNMPFGRPRLSEMLKSLEFVMEKNYPARGEK